VRCGQPLLAARLEILPATARCMPCQQVTESSVR
jgi:RNA polymerase-binding transcription factor DksA